MVAGAGTGFTNQNIAIIIVMSETNSFLCLQYSKTIPGLGGCSNTAAVSIILDLLYLFRKKRTSCSQCI